MKKNISINIGGIIFHIEEDGYEKLQSYLSEINAYFRKYDDYTEIIADIEGRVAEIFSGKLSKDKEVITIEDVEQLIVTMGTVADFASIEEDESYEEPVKTESKLETPRRFYRDLKHKVLGGVCSGLAHYYKVDPLWARILFLILFFGFIIIPPASGIAVILYIALWIALPGVDNLEEDRKIKKLYRNPDDKVLGGVASGLAAYFGTETAIIRLIFVLSVLLFGTGVIIYIVLWFIAPEAKTMTDKMQMKGDPVTLSNIEHSVKKNLQNDPDKDETPVVSILLFPFRLIGKLFEFLGKALGPLLEVLGKFLRIAFGLLLMLVSFSMILTLVVLLGAVIGIYVSPDFWLDGLPLSVVTNTIPTVGAFAGVFALGIPSLALGFLGLRLLTLKPVVSNAVTWTMFGVWVVASIVSVSSIPGVVKSFEDENSIVGQETFILENKTLVLDAREQEMESYDAVQLTIRPHESSEILLEKEIIARGSSKDDALKNAKMISYSVAMQDSILLFDSDVAFKADALMRAQEVELYLYIPVGQQFVMTENLYEILHNTVHYYDYRYYDMGNVFVFRNLNDLSCLTCDRTRTDGSFSGRNSDYSKVFDVSGDIADITIKGEYKIHLKQDSTMLVEVIGRKSKVEEVKFDYDLSDRHLEIAVDDFDEDFNFRGRAPVYINISLPDFHKVEVFGRNDLKAENLVLDDFQLHMAGFSDADISGEFKELSLETEGVADIYLQGSVEEFKVELAGKTELDAAELIAENADVKAYGKSDAWVHVTNYLNAYAAGISEIDYSGNPEKVDDKTAGLSKISRKN